MKHTKRGIKRLSMLLSILLLLTLATLFTPMNVSASVPYTRVIAMKIGSPLALLNGNAAAYDNQGTKPVILKGRTMLPLRFVGEKLGASVTWTDNKQPIVIKLDGKKITLQLGSKKMTVEQNGKKAKKTLDSPATLYNGRTMVPIRAISEALGFMVHYQNTGGVATVVVSNTTITPEKRDSAHRNVRDMPLTPVKKQSAALTINQSSAKLVKGKTLQLTVKTQNISQTTALTWTTNNKAVATVDGFGMVTAHANGRAVIKAKSAGGKEITCTVTVGETDPDTIPVEKVSLDKTSMTLMIWSTKQDQNKYGKPGDSYGSKGILYEEVSPRYATNTKVTWASDNKSVATVDANGIVTGRSVGTAHVTATSHNGKKATCTVTVKANVRACVYDKKLSDEVFKLVNAFRSENGVPKLAYNEACAGYAYRQAEYNATQDLPNKETHSAGQIGCWGGLYSDHNTSKIPQRAVDSWKESPAHRASLLDDFPGADIMRTDGGCAVFIIKVNGVVEEYVCIFDFDYIDIPNGAMPKEDPGISK